MAIKKRAWVSGNPGAYVLHVCALPEAGDYWPLNGLTFNKYRAAQNIANAANVAINAVSAKGVIK